MVYALDLVDAPITCHAWNADGTQLALCPNTSNLLIYQVNGKKAEVVWTLSEHTQVISSVDWNWKTGQIVTCSHDRNAYVWEFDAKAQAWKKDLVVLRLKRAATYVRWSHNGEKFAVATGSDKIRVCGWSKDHNFWQAFSFSTDKPTSLTADFGVDDLHILVSGTDRHCRYITTVDEEKKTKSKGKKKVEDWTLSKFSCQGWCNCSAISPSGAWAAFAAQDSYIRFVQGRELVGPEDAQKHALNVPGLPFLSIQFLSDRALVGAGFDCQPRLFWFDGTTWVDLGFVDKENIRDAGGLSGGGGSMADRLQTYGGKTTQKKGTLHQNIILGVRFQPTLGAFTTCANDGRIGVWPLAQIKLLFAGKDLGF